MNPREKREAAVAVAQGELLRGVKETTGQNDGPDIEKYLKGDKGLAWCAAFVIWCYEQAGINFPGNRWRNRKVSDFWRTLNVEKCVLQIPEGRLPASVRRIPEPTPTRLSRAIHESPNRPPEVGESSSWPPIGNGKIGRPYVRPVLPYEPPTFKAFQPGSTSEGATDPGVQPIPAPGDLIFLSRRGQSDAGTGWHMGIIESVTMDNITSIDGNWKNRVCRVHRSWTDNSVVGFGRYPPDGGT